MPGKFFYSEPFIHGRDTHITQLLRTFEKGLRKLIIVEMSF